MRTGKDRVQLAPCRRPLLVDGVTIHPGDLVCADEDGAWSCPPTAPTKSHRRRTAHRARRGRHRRRRPRRVHPDRGPRRHGYHALQTADRHLLDGHRHHRRTTPSNRGPPPTPRAPPPADARGHSSTTPARLLYRAPVPRRTRGRSTAIWTSTPPSRPPGPEPAWPAPRSPSKAPAGTTSPCTTRSSRPCRAGARRRRRRRAFGHWGEVLAVAAQARGLPGWSSTAASVTSTSCATSASRLLPEQHHPRHPQALRRAARRRSPGRRGHLSVRATWSSVTPTASSSSRNRWLRVLETSDERVAKEADIIRRLRAGDSTLDVYGLMRPGVAESGNPIFRIADRAAAPRASGVDVITLAAGEPGAPTAAHIVDAAVTAAREPRTHHCGPAAGLADLPEQAAAQHPVHVTADQVQVRVAPSTPCTWRWVRWPARGMRCSCCGPRWPGMSAPWNWSARRS